MLDRVFEEATQTLSSKSNLSLAKHVSWAATMPVEGFLESRVEAASIALTIGERLLGAGDTEWIGVVLNLTDPNSPVSGKARRLLVKTYGAATCADITAMVEDPPAPQTVVAFTAARLTPPSLVCDGSADLFFRLVDDDRWSEDFLAVGELRGLIASAPQSERLRMVPVLAAELDAIVARFDEALDPRTLDPSLDLSLFALASVALNGMAIDHPIAWTKETRLTIGNQIATEGGLPDVYSGPVGLWDVAIQEWLVSLGQLEESVYTETRAAEAASDNIPATPVEAVGLHLWRDGAVPTCREAADVLASRGDGRRSPIHVLAEAAAVARSQSCQREQELNFEEMLSQRLEASAPEGSFLEAWAAVYAGCWIAPAGLPEQLRDGLDLSPAFDDDPFAQYAVAFASTPAESCRRVTAVREGT